MSDQNPPRTQIIEAASLHVYPMSRAVPVWEQLLPEHIPEWESDDVFLFECSGEQFGVRRREEAWRLYQFGDEAQIVWDTYVSTFEDLRAILRAIEHASDPEGAFEQLSLFNKERSVRGQTLH